MTSESNAPDRRPLASRQTAWAQASARWLVARRVSPNGISVAGMVFALAGAAAFAGLRCGCVPAWAALVGGVCGAQLRLLCNLLDGMVAVEGGLKGKAGNLFNEAPDRFADIVLLVGAGYGIGQTTLGWSAAALAVLVAYVRALGASLGQGQDFCGPGAKPQRMFFLTVGALAAIFYGPALGFSLWLIVALSAVTAVRRTVRLYRKLP